MAKQSGQKFKSMLVAQMLLKYSDEEHPLSVEDIQEHLQSYGIDAEHHSIVRDINDLEDLLNIEEKQSLKEEQSFKAKQNSKEEQVVFLYNRAKLGYTIERGFRDRVRVFYVSERPYELEDVQLISECVNNAKFVTDKKARQLNEMIGSLVSEAQAEKLINNAYTTGRVKTQNNKIIYAVNAINEAIKAKKMITFPYYHYELKNVAVQKPSRKGKPIAVSPFALVINDNNYYLICYSSEREKMMTYRVDRMGEVKIVDIPRDGEDEFAQINMKEFTQRVFGMFRGEKKRVTIRFINPLLDTAIDRFGTGSNVTYSKIDDTHFTVSADIEISDQFFSWVCGFRKKAKIVSPQDVVEKMEKYISDLSNMYQKD